MRVTTRTFWLPKYGNTNEEYEDAFWPVELVSERSLQGFRCAVADGATETSFSGAWANLLTQCWCTKTDFKQFLSNLPALQEEWASQIEALPMAWYAEEKARSGAYSAFLGLMLSDTDPDANRPACWEAIAVGDSCLFQIRGAKNLVSFPLRQVEEFNSRPYLLSTTPQSESDLKDNMSLLSGWCVPGDVFYLMTDSLACWFLRTQKEGDGDSYAATTITDIDNIRDSFHFQDFVRNLRSGIHDNGQPDLRNDDVTFYRLEVHE